MKDDFLKGFHPHGDPPAATLEFGPGQPPIPLNAPQQRQKTIDEYHRLWYDEASKGLTWGSTTYFGVKLWKHPADLHLYSELIYQVQPALIIETGTAFGGSALYMAHLLDQLGHGKVLSIDLNAVQKTYPRHPRIAYLGGYSSTHLRSVKEAGLMAIEAARGQGAVMVILDSDHAERHVAQELRCYASLVTPSAWKKLLSGGRTKSLSPTRLRCGRRRHGASTSEPTVCLRIRRLTPVSRRPSLSCTFTSNERVHLRVRRPGG